MEISSIEASDNQQSLQPTATIILAIELVLALFIGSGLMALGLGGAAGILGGIAAGALVFSGWRSLSARSMQPNRTARKIGQTIVGLAIGLSLQPDRLDTIAAQLPVFVGLPLFLMVCGGAIGWVYSRLEKTDLFTALLATTPGNIGVMASIAADYSKNTPLVSLIQLMRFTSVMLAVPIIANVAVAHLPQRNFSAFAGQLLHISWLQLPISGLMLAIALLVGYLGGKLKIPMAAFLGAIAIGLLFDNSSWLFPALSHVDWQLPPAVNLVGQILLGITIGEYWGINPPLKLATVARAVVPVSLMFVAGFAAAAIVKLLTSWNWLTCLLIAAPGGSPEMIWIALTLHQDTEIVTAGHIVRLLAINLTLPLLVSLAYYFDRHSIERSERTSHSQTPSQPQQPNTQSNIVLR